MSTDNSTPGGGPILETVEGQTDAVPEVRTHALTPAEAANRIEVLKREKRDAVRVYGWLLISPLLTFPCFAIQIFGLSSRPSAGERIWAALVPLVCHVVLLTFLASRDLFVIRHTQQGLILVAFRTLVGAVALIMSASLSSSWVLVFFGGGALWLFGSIWGRNQAVRGDCWLMRRKGETVDLPRPWRLIEAPIPEAEGHSEPPPQPISLPQPERSPLVAMETASPDRTSTPPDPAQVEKGIANLLTLFRTGTPAQKQEALEQLAAMGQVEVF